jgi:diadenosine tetraphosphatase ApaH/serine/threonine PP2A family protein phosphatase
MPPLAVVSDIHANFPALLAVLEETERRDIHDVVCLGDIVGYGPWPNECVDLISKSCTVVVQGNHDSGVTGGTPEADFNARALLALRWTRRELSPANHAYLADLPLRASRNDMTFVHASPHDPGAWRYLCGSAYAAADFAALDTRVCFVGHTHVPQIIAEGGSAEQPEKTGRYIINVGSVGQPRDGSPHAAFGVFDEESGEFELVRVPYPVEKTAEAILAAGLPPAFANRLFRGL